MTTYWRIAGLSYLQYSSICAKLLRQALKPEYRVADVARKESSGIKVFKWKESKPGKPESIRQSQ